MKRTNHTLLEQMQLGDVEILRRMELLELDSQALDLLISYKLIIEDNIDDIVEQFYQKQIRIDEIVLLIGDADTLARLRAALRKYTIDLFSGNYDSVYVNNRLRIGMVHKRIGVEPKFFLSAVRTLKELLIKTLENVIKEKEDLNKVLDLLDKLLYFDTTLVFDTYIDSLVEEVNTAKRRTEIYAESLENKIAERTKQLEEQAERDPLTNIYNQRVMYKSLRRELALAKRHQSKLSLVYFDVDDFKEINDKEGHLKGDEVLRYIAQCMVKHVRETDIACRYGGDEFTIIFPECSTADAKTICEKIIKEFSGKYPDYSLSIGIAETGERDFIDENQLIKMADENMYLAKQESGFQIRT